jgi:hypothetical protein
MPEAQVVETRMAQPVHLTLTKNAKAQHQWEISIHAETTEKVLEQTLELDEALTEKFKGEASEK